LVSASNPENGTVNYFYDEQGNVQVQTDARGVSKHFSYDALNRLTRRWYNGSSSTSATLNNSPTLPANVGTSDEVSFVYDSQSLPGGAPAGFQRGYATGRLVAVNYGTGSSAGDYFGYDALGRAVIKVQQTGGVNYQMTTGYNNGGALTSITYPSGHVVNYNYDQAGRLGDRDAQHLAMTGNLGDGVTRTYSTGIAYSPFGGMSKEQFGSDTALYHKLHYNIRGQLYDVRLSTVNDDLNWNRGAIVNYYSFQPYGFGTSGPDNNGNLLVQQNWIPTDDAVSGYSFMQQNYDYDGLNRLKWIGEYQNGAPQTGGQEFFYDRYGNRTLNPASWGAGINNQQFAVDTNTNRLGVPAGQSGVMQYDQAGNLTNDTYTGQGQRIYDAGNKITQAWANGQWQTSTYDGQGQRVKRNVNGMETRQVYGLGGELLAEYAANASPSNPQKEYGYRNGELLVTAAAGVNLALNKPTTQSSTGWGGESSRAVDGNTSGNWFDNSVTHTFYDNQAWWQVDLGSTQSIGTINVWNRTDCCESRLTNFNVVILDQNQNVVASYNTPGQGGSPSSISTNVSGRYVRVQLVGTDYLSLAEVQVLNAGADVRWMVTDQLGTPRIIADKTGSLAGISRHDYLPFGEELFAGTGSRTAAQGYSQADGVREHFTGYERDNETGLDYAHARYYANTQGRFTGVDPVSGSVGNPQTWNGYTYTLNNPVNLTDPTGMFANAEYGYDPGRDYDPFMGYSRMRALWANELERALAAYQQMVDQGLQNLKQKRQQKKQQQPQVVDVAKDKTINQQVAQINKAAKPLASGKSPVLTSVRVITGDTYNVDNATIIDAYGRQTVGGFDGTILLVAYVPLDQGGNIIQPNNGTGVQENISRDGGPAELLPPDGPAPAPPRTGGVFIDMQAIARGQPTSHVQQAVAVTQSSTGRMFVTGDNYITQNAPVGNKPGSISVKIGRTNRVK
jgi:RHS repeat-associated protein